MVDGLDTDASGTAEADLDPGTVRRPPRNAMTGVGPQQTLLKTSIISAYCG